jgi:hypothetical protein
MYQNGLGLAQRFVSTSCVMAADIVFTGVQAVKKDISDPFSSDHLW